MTPAALPAAIPEAPDLTPSTPPLETAPSSSPLEPAADAAGTPAPTSEAPARTTGGDENRVALLAQIDARYRAVRAERGKHSLAGPIVMLAGAGVCAMLTLVTAAEYGLDQIDSEQSGGVTKVALAAICTVVAAALGTTWLASRVRARRAYDPELRELKARRQELMLEVSPRLTKGAAGASVSLRF